MSAVATLLFPFFSTVFGSYRALYAVRPAAVPLVLSGCNLTLYLSLILSLFSQYDHLWPSPSCESNSFSHSFFQRLVPPFWWFSPALLKPIFCVCVFFLFLLHLVCPAPLAFILLSCHLPGSPFRDEITLAILQLQENNRLEILKRRWWEGGQCPKEEDHRAKGQLTAAVCLLCLLLSNVPGNSLLTLCYSPADG